MASSALNALFSNPHYIDAIPKLLGNWKHPLFKHLISPSPAILQRAEIIKQDLLKNSTGELIAIQVRRGDAFSIVTDAQVNNMFECAKFFAKTSNPKFWLAADTVNTRNLARIRFGENVQWLSAIPTHSANRFDGFEDTILDWWMIGQARLAVITAASTFGQTAVDRSGSERFIVGGLTQCTNPNKDYYLEKIYSSPLENWEKEGRIVYNPFI